VPRIIRATRNDWKAVFAPPTREPPRSLAKRVL